MAGGADALRVLGLFLSTCAGTGADANLEAPDAAADGRALHVRPLLLASVAGAAAALAGALPRCFPAESAALAMCADASPALHALARHPSAATYDPAHPELVLAHTTLLATMRDVAAANGFRGRGRGRAEEALGAAVGALVGALEELLTGLLPAVEGSLAALAGFDFHGHAAVDADDSPSDPMGHPERDGSAEWGGALRHLQATRRAEVEDRIFELEGLLDCLLALRTLVAGLAAAAGPGGAGGNAACGDRAAALAAHLDREMQAVFFGPPPALTSTATSADSRQGSQGRGLSRATLATTQAAVSQCGRYLAVAILDHRREALGVLSAHDTEETRSQSPPRERATGQPASAFMEAEVSVAALGGLASALLEPLAHQPPAAPHAAYAALRTTLPALVRGAALNMPSLALWAFGKLAVFGVERAELWAPTFEEAWLACGSGVLVHLAVTSPAAFAEAVVLPLLRLGSAPVESMMCFIMKHLAMPPARPALALALGWTHDTHADDTPPAAGWPAMLLDLLAPHVFSLAGLALARQLPHAASSGRGGCGLLPAPAALTAEERKAVLANLPLARAGAPPPGGPSEPWMPPLRVLVDPSSPLSSAMLYRLLLSDAAQGATERDLLCGRFKDIVDGCAAGLEIPLSLADTSVVFSRSCPIHQNTICALIWDLGADNGRARAAKKALRIICPLLVAGSWSVAVGGGRGARPAPPSKESVTEDVAQVLAASFNFALWHLAQMKWKFKASGEQEQSLRALRELVGLLKQADLSKVLPKIVIPI